MSVKAARKSELNLRAGVQGWFTSVTLAFSVDTHGAGRRRSLYRPLPAWARGSWPSKTGLEGAVRFDAMTGSGGSKT